MRRQFGGACLGRVAVAVRRRKLRDRRVGDLKGVRCRTARPMTLYGSSTSSGSFDPAGCWFAGRTMLWLLRDMGCSIPSSPCSNDSVRVSIPPVACDSGVTKPELGVQAAGIDESVSSGNSVAASEFSPRARISGNSVELVPPIDGELTAAELDTKGAAASGPMTEELSTTAAPITVGPTVVVGAGVVTGSPIGAAASMLRISSSSKASRRLRRMARFLVVLRYLELVM